MAWLGVIVASLFILPIVAVLIGAAMPGQGSWAHLAETVLPRYITNTAILAIGVGIGVMVIGTLTGWLTTMCAFPGRRLFQWALVLPLASPGYVIAYAYTDFLQFSGPAQTVLREVMGWQAGEYWFPHVRSLGGAMTMLIFVLYPYVYLLSRAAFLEQSVCALEVSRTLGCTAWSTFWRVALPTARPAIVAGTALALMETLADYGTVSFFGVQTFTTGIVRAWLSFGDYAAATQLAAILLGFVLVVLAMEQWSRARERYHHTSSRYRPLQENRLKGVMAAGAIVACSVPVIIGFVLPSAILVSMMLDVSEFMVSSRFLALIENSVTLAAITACLAVFIAVFLAYGTRLQSNSILSVCTQLAGMGYAVPGIVIAVGILVPTAKFDNLLDGWLRDTFGISTGLLLTGTIASLVFAYLVRFLAVALNTVRTSLGKISPNTAAAARTLGATPLRALVRVHIPIMRGSLLTAGLLVFVDVIKELPATLMMRPFNFDTLAVQAYNFASDERLAEASVPSLAIVLAGLMPLLLLSRAIARSRPGSGITQ